MSMILMMVAIFAIMWFFMIRPQQKKQKEIQKFQNELTEGTQVVTGGGIYGTVKSIDLAKNTVEVKIARDVVVTVDKSYVFKNERRVSDFLILSHPFGHLLVTHDAQRNL